ncbi:MAG: TAXI family TRAP transporter solute-binding subunit [Chloroflexota bacterium]
MKRSAFAKGRHAPLTPLILVGLALVVPLLTLQCGPKPEAKRISIATGGTGGVYYPYGGGLAKLISQYVPNTEATAEVTAASVDNCKLINDGKADLALIMADVGYDALQGTGKFKETGKMALRTLANLYGNYMHLVTAEGSGINTVADLRGKKISTGAPGSGTEVKALRVLEAYGIDPAKDTKQEKLGVSESAAAMKDRKLDAFFWDGGLPTAAILDLSATPGFKMKLISHEDAIPKMVEKYGPVYFKLVIPKGTYGGVEADTSVAGVANLLIASDKFDEKLAYNIVKAMFDHKPDLVAVHKEAEKLTLQSAVVGSPLPFHPGAIRYYKEKGVWK